MTNPQTEYDSLWKDILQLYFEEFMLFFFPEAYREIDWTRKPEFLDKELQEVVRDAELGRRFADKLVKLYRNSGEENWILVHIEVQSQEESNFAKRMYTYNYRIYDRYERSIASLAVLGDEHANWRPSRFGFELFGCRVDFQFPVVKLVDYKHRLGELEASRNPFATVVMAHLAALETSSDRLQRKQQKLALVRRLYALGFKRQDVLNLLAFVDWMLTLPLELEAEFNREVEQLEAEQRMKYITSFERLGIEKGKHSEALSLVTRLLNRRLGHSIEDTLVERLRSLSVEELEALGEALLDFTEVGDLIAWLEQQ